MMDLRVSAVLLFVFLTGGHSLKCYTCSSAPGGTCEAKVETCGNGFSKCESIAREKTVDSAKLWSTVKRCAVTCEAGNQHVLEEGTEISHCCDTDLCNGADGAYKGSFLLLSAPLLFYFLFQ
ncbi:lymphocyte antigen 6 complex locus protein G6d-like [Puntigrus tetrazona]|uniref:lymphocyte antigen 6 complex locus protein G6d-like n=1 Tax=Puntigrus tetrazona TaxID=1606681 RepID=UPI001C8ACD7D|nr:lymphocyte antigen 6 complex locus protein G6d-like [Puntigrus tetrazona]